MDDLISRQELIDICDDVIECGIPNELGLHPIVVEVVKFAVETMPSAQQWIPCSERLPEEDGRYLCTYSDFGVCVDFGLYADGQWIIEPIAWMPLPEPWEGEK